MSIRVAAIIINDNREILLIHRIKHNNEYFVLPGGGIEDGETEIDAIIREAKEETNLDIIPNKIIIEIQNVKFNRKELYYTIKSFTGTPMLGGPELGRQSNDNIYKLEWVKIKELQNYNLYPTEVLNIIYNLENNPK